MYDVMKMYVWNVALIAKLYSCVHAALTAKLWKFLNNIYGQNCIRVYSPEKATPNWRCCCGIVYFILNSENNNFAKNYKKQNEKANKKRNLLEKGKGPEKKKVVKFG